MSERQVSFSQGRPSQQYTDARFNTSKAVAGLDLRQILEKAQIGLSSKLESGSILADFNDPSGDRIQVILE